MTATTIITGTDVSALAGQRADVTAVISWRTRTYENAIIVRTEGGQLILADPGEYGRYEQASVALADVRNVTNLRPAIGLVAVLHGHDSPETAYLIEDYPYGRQLRCQMRVWIEQAAKGAARGQYRVMRQTNDPKRVGSGRYGEGPGGHPWNAPKASTYSDWMVLYLDENERVQDHRGSLIHGIGGAGDARLRLDGTYGQLTDDERKRYDLMVRMGQRNDSHSLESWRQALAFFAAYQEEHGGALPGPAEVQAAEGFHLDGFLYVVAVAAVTAGLAAAA